MNHAVLAALLSLASTAGGAPGRRLSSAEEARALFKEGMAAKMRGDFAASLDAFTKAMAVNESMPGLHLARGLTYLDSMMALSRYENHHNAETDLMQAVKEAPKNPLALAALALTRAMNADPRGENDLAKASAIRPNLPAYGHAAVGRFHLDAGRAKDAVASYREAYAASPQDSPLSEWIRREMIVVRDRLRVRHEAAPPPTPAEVKFEPEPFLQELASANPQERSSAARSLGRLGLQEAISPLSALLPDKELEVRASALQALGHIGEPQGVPSILPFLKDKSKFMRSLAVRALGEIGSERARKPLMELIAKEKDPMVLADAKVAIKSIDDAVYTMKMDLDLLMEEVLGK